MLRSSVLILLAAAGLSAGYPPTESQVEALRHLGGPCTGKIVVNPRGEFAHHSLPHADTDSFGLCVAIHQDVDGLQSLR
jgi:hypothetical protein